MGWDDEMSEYDPMVAPDPEVWLAMDEGERMMLIGDYVEENEPGIEGAMAHVGMHLMVENQIAMGEETPVRDVHERLMREGLDRHEAIHAVATAFAQVMFELKDDPDIDMTGRYYEELEKVTAVTWRALAEGDEEAPARPKDPVGRNDPCPCGSGKKYKKCCWGQRN